MLKMGFCNKWTQLVMRCVTTVSYSVLLNGSPSKAFTPERGLRQGDPLSPYLFILCADVLSCLLKRAESNGELHGIKVTRNAPAVSHLFFADDSILFFKANRQELSNVQKVIQEYEMASGQRINMDKTEITASGNVSDSLIAELCETVGVRRVQHHQKYLGLPTLIGRSKKQVFSIILERVEQKCKSWKETMLSKAGKEVMLKSVVAAIPMYTMNCFLLPQETLHAIEQVMARFYWGSKEGERKIHWVGWKGMARKKDEGGLGLRDLRCFNLAMLGRQLWHLLQHEDTIIFQILKAKYFPRSGILEAGLGYQPSYLWRSLLASKSIIEEGMAWRVGDGQSIVINNNKWIGGPQSRNVTVRDDIGIADMRVADLIQRDTMSWNKDLVRQLLPDDADQILAIPLSQRKPPDLRVWRFTKLGIFSVKSAYHLAMKISDKGEQGGPSVPSTHWKHLWKMKLQPRITHFLWQACHDALPTMANLKHRGVELDPICKLCGEEFETLDHLLLKCRITTEVWYLCPLRARGMADMGTFKHWFWCSTSKFPRDYVQLLILVGWHIWKMRCGVCMEGKQWSLEDILARIQKSWADVEPPTMGNGKSSRNVGTREEVWIPPPAGWLKLDCDVAVISETRIGMGFILRDENRNVLMAAKDERDAAGSSTRLEGVALLFAMSTVTERGFTRLIVSSDNLQLIQAIHGDTRPSAFEDIIVEDIKAMATTIRHISFAHIRRELNQAAHFMARGPKGIFLNVIPPHINAFV